MYRIWLKTGSTHAHSVEPSVQRLWKEERYFIRLFLISPLLVHYVLIDEQVNLNNEQLDTTACRRLCTGGREVGSSLKFHASFKVTLSVHHLHLMSLISGSTPSSCLWLVYVDPPCFHFLDSSCRWTSGLQSMYYVICPVYWLKWSSWCLFQMFISLFYQLFIFWLSAFSH